jgi:single-strand DNA-binding protein
MINKAILVGRITRDPELRKTNTGLSTVSFTLACNRRFSNNQGGQDADFINCVAWRGAAEFMANYVKKGNQLGVEGRIQTRDYKDQTDRKVYVTEVVCESVQLLESKKDTQEPKEVARTNTQVVEEQAPYSEFGSDVIDIGSDDLPF